MHSERFSVDEVASGQAPTGMYSETFGMVPKQYEFPHEEEDSDVRGFRLYRAFRHLKRSFYENFDEVSRSVFFGAVITFTAMVVSFADYFVCAANYSHLAQLILPSTLFFLSVCVLIYRAPPVRRCLQRHFGFGNANSYTLEHDVSSRETNVEGAGLRNVSPRSKASTSYKNRVFLETLAIPLQSSSV